MNDELVNMANAIIKTLSEAYPDQELDPSRLDYHVAQIVAANLALSRRLADAETAEERATEWLNGIVAMCAREILYFRQYDVTKDEIHHAHQTFVGLMYQSLFALTSEKDFDVLRQRVLAQIEQAADVIAARDGNGGA